MHQHIRLPVGFRYKDNGFYQHIKYTLVLLMRYLHESVSNRRYFYSFYKFAPKILEKKI